MNTDMHIPACVGIIMDGNRRWAHERGLPTLEGHRKGYGKLKDVVGWCKDVGVPHLVVYALSTENWNRSEDEVSYLMDLFREMSVELRELQKEKGSIRFVGDLSRFPEDIQKLMADTHTQNPPDAEHHLWIAASYGGRPEILAGVNALLVKGVHEVTEADFAAALWTAGMPDPDIIIRTGGDKRLSNFLTWGSVYSELFFTETKWPAFAKEEFSSILGEYGNRERRHGK